MNIKTCKFCGADIIWATLENGDSAPMDAEGQYLATFDPGKTKTYYLDDHGFGNVDALLFENHELKQGLEFHLRHYCQDKA